MSATTAVAPACADSSTIRGEESTAKTSISRWAFTQAHKSPGPEPTSSRRRGHATRIRARTISSSSGPSSSSLNASARCRNASSEEYSSATASGSTNQPVTHPEYHRDPPSKLPHETFLITRAGKSLVFERASIAQVVK
jgi:hypothetical protein